MKSKRKQLLVQEHGSEYNTSNPNHNLRTQIKGEKTEKDKDIGEL